MYAQGLFLTCNPAVVCSPYMGTSSNFFGGRAESKKAAGVMAFVVFSRALPPDFSVHIRKRNLGMVFQAASISFRRSSCLVVLEETEAREFSSPAFGCPLALFLDSLRSSGGISASGSVRDF